MSKFKMIEIKNSNIGAVAVNGLIPLGTIIRKIDCGTNCPAFMVTSSNSDTVTISEAGYYEITYSITALATATGLNSVTLVLNGVDLYQVGQTVSTAGDAINLTLPYTARVYARCNNMATNNPMTVQFRADTAMNSATANLIIKKIY